MFLIVGNLSGNDFFPPSFYGQNPIACGQSVYLIWPEATGYAVFVNAAATVGQAAFADMLPAARRVDVAAAVHQQVFALAHVTYRKETHFLRSFKKAPPPYQAPRSQGGICIGMMMTKHATDCCSLILPVSNIIFLKKIYSPNFFKKK